MPFENITRNTKEAMNLFFIMLLFMFVVDVTASMETNVITTKTGKVQGVVEPSSISGKYVQKFSNIPYAEAPVGKLRFAKPEPKKPWNDTLKSSDVAIGCWQVIEYKGKNVSLTEDCLILNVWTPFPQKSNRSVMVWIHGGAFRWGLSATYPGHNIVALSDVILVTINYRLSVFGFLSTGDGRIKGNFGLFDQRLATKWVKDNIASFGGDPQSITIFGLSAGAVSVSAHTLSSGSWPYFNRAIMQSGGMNMPWAMATEEHEQEALSVFLHEVNCNDNQDLLECLQSNITKEDLENIYITNSNLNDIWLAPNGNDADFFPDVPEVLYDQSTFKDGDVLMGVAKDEDFLQSGHLLQTLKNISEFIGKFDDDMEEHFGNESSDEVFDQAIELYNADEDFQSKIEALVPIIDFNSDIWFVCPATEEAVKRSQSAQSRNIYFYRYSHVSKIPIRTMYPNGTAGFAAHATDVISLFGFPVNNSIYPAEDQVLSSRIILYWTNFAKNGDPNVGITKLPIAIDGIDTLPEWPKFTDSNRKYLDMESESRMVIRKRLREQYCEFLSDPESFIAGEGEGTTTTEETHEGTGLPTTIIDVRVTTLIPTAAVQNITPVVQLVTVLLGLLYIVL